MKDKPHIAVLGATSFVGDYLLPLLTANYQVVAFSRQTRVCEQVNWLSLDNLSSAPPLDYVICVAPIWLLVDYLPQLSKHPLQKIVVLSSTSIFTKTRSTDMAEQVLVERLVRAEEQIQDWAITHHIEWVVLRPTMIYSLGRDKNLSEIVKMIKKFGFFPILGSGKGLRQPIHAQDVAQACVAALCAKQAANKSYNLSGAEILTYQQLITKIFLFLDRPVRILTIPIGLFKILVLFARMMPRYRHLSLAMVERMNQDMSFDHYQAKLDFNFSPKKLEL